MMVMNCYKLALDRIANRVKVGRKVEIKRNNSNSNNNNLEVYRKTLDLCRKFQKE